MMNILDAPSPGSAKIPALVYAIYQSMFAAITPILAIGGSAERGRLGPLLVFVFVWSTLVYDPIACSTWAPNGWYVSRNIVSHTDPLLGRSSSAHSTLPAVDPCT